MLQFKQIRRTKGQPSLLKTLDIIPTPCPNHYQYTITNLCKSQNCIQPLCPECISYHMQLHQQQKTSAKIQNIINIRLACIQQLTKIQQDIQQQISKYNINVSQNIQLLLSSYHKKLDLAYKKIIKLLDNTFSNLRKQVQALVETYSNQKQKKNNQTKLINNFLIRIATYKQQLQSSDYLSALTSLLSQPLIKPKLPQQQHIQYSGCLQLNQKYLQDIKSNLSNYIKIHIAKSQPNKNKLSSSMIKKNFYNTHTNILKQFDRSLNPFNHDQQKSPHGKDWNEFKNRSVHKSKTGKKMFGFNSEASDSRLTPRPTINIQITNKKNNIRQQSYFRSPQSPHKTLPSSAYKTPPQKPQKIKYDPKILPIRITKQNYFTSNKSTLWYFKQSTKYGYKANLQRIQTGFQKVQLNINFLIPEGHSTINHPNSIVYLLGGQNIRDKIVTNKVYQLLQQDKTLKQIQPMLQVRSYFGCCYFQNSIYVAGGLSSSSTNPIKKPINSLQRYKLHQRKWQKLSDLPQPSYLFKMHPTTSGKLIKFGGLTDSQNFLQKLDIYSIYNNSWSTYLFDNKFILTINPGITQISPQSLLIFGGKIPQNNKKISKCYILSQQQNQHQYCIGQGPSLDHKATFQSSYIHDGIIVAIQNNQLTNRTKLIFRYKFM